MTIPRAQILLTSSSCNIFLIFRRCPCQNKAKLIHINQQLFKMNNVKN
ncbi:MAG: hypothetical protein ACKPKO_64430 [Candidatus Fonsibacter sp.]